MNNLNNHLINAINQIITRRNSEFHGGGDGITSIELQTQNKINELLKQSEFDKDKIANDLTEILKEAVIKSFIEDSNNATIDETKQKIIGLLDSTAVMDETKQKIVGLLDSTNIIDDIKKHVLDILLNSSSIMKKPNDNNKSDRDVIMEIIKTKVNELLKGGALNEIKGKIQELLQQGEILGVLKSKIIQLLTDKGSGKPGFDKPGKPGFDKPGKPGFDKPGKPGFDKPSKPGFDKPGATGSTSSNSSKNKGEHLGEQHSKITRVDIVSDIVGDSPDNINNPIQIVEHVENIDWPPGSNTSTSETVKNM
jgi:hypothetical protein